MRGLGLGLGPQFNEKTSENRKGRNLEREREKKKRKFGRSGGGGSSERGREVGPAKEGPAKGGPAEGVQLAEGGGSSEGGSGERGSGFSFSFFLSVSLCFLLFSLVFVSLNQKRSRQKAVRLEACQKRSGQKSGPGQKRSLSTGYLASLSPSTRQGVHLAAPLENSTLRRVLNFFSPCFQVSLQL